MGYIESNVHVVDSFNVSFNSIDVRCCQLFSLPVSKEILSPAFVFMEFASFRLSIQEQHAYDKCNRILRSRVSILKCQYLCCKQLVFSSRSSSFQIGSPVNSLFSYGKFVAAFLFFICCRQIVVVLIELSHFYFFVKLWWS